MADNLRVKLGNFVIPVASGTDAAGHPRAFLGHPAKPGKLVYKRFQEAVAVADKVLAQNPHVVAQVRPLKPEPTGVFATDRGLYAVAVARRAS